MDKSGSVSVWRGRLESFAQSNMSVRAWCSQQSIPEHQYYYWRRRIADISKKAAAEAPSPSPRYSLQSKADAHWLSALVIPEEPHHSTQSTVTVRIAGAEIPLTHGFDPALLRAVVQALGEQPC